MPRWLNVSRFSFIKAVDLTKRPLMASQLQCVRKQSSLNNIVHRLDAVNHLVPLLDKMISTRFNIMDIPFDCGNHHRSFGIVASVLPVHERLQVRHGCL